MAEVRAETAAFLPCLPMCRGPSVVSGALLSSPLRQLPWALLAELPPEPAWLPPTGGFPGCGCLSSNILRHLQRQESDLRLQPGPWERGCTLACDDPARLGQAVSQGSIYSTRAEGESDAGSSSPALQQPAGEGLGAARGKGSKAGRLLGAGDACAGTCQGSPLWLRISHRASCSSMPWGLSPEYPCAPSGQGLQVRNVPFRELHQGSRSTFSILSPSQLLPEQTAQSRRQSSARGCSSGGKQQPTQPLRGSRRRAARSSPVLPPGCLPRSPEGPHCTSALE